MLDALGVASLEDLMARTLPNVAANNAVLATPKGVSEEVALEEISSKLGRNIVAKAMIGQGYHGTHMPPVIQRNMFEYPGWISGTPLEQAEVSQGRLEMLFHFQTLVCELTGHSHAVASAMNEAEAVAHAARMAVGHYHGKRSRIVVSRGLHPQSFSMLDSCAGSGQFTVDSDKIDEDVAAVVLQVPDTDGSVGDLSGIIAAAKAVGALVIVCADPLSLVLLKSPSSWGADICVGSMQRFGLPMGNGGPNVTYVAVGDHLSHFLPGPAVVESTDVRGNAAYQMAHANGHSDAVHNVSSFEASQSSLYANLVAAYGIWHGPDGLVAIAERVNAFAARFGEALASNGYPVAQHYFDTVTVVEKGRAHDLAAEAEGWGLLLRVIDADTVSIAFDETSNETDLQSLCSIFDVPLIAQAQQVLPNRRSHEEFLTQTVFKAHRSEADMTRFLRRLVDKDLTANRQMVPSGAGAFGSMAAASMMPVTWELTGNIQPLAPADHRLGYKAIMADLEKWLPKIARYLSRLEASEYSSLSNSLLGTTSQLLKHFSSEGHPKNGVEPQKVNAALPILWMQLRMLGGAGIKRAGEVAILNAAYMTSKLGTHFVVLRDGTAGSCDHQCRVDIRTFKKSAGVTGYDIARRLIDYGFSAPKIVGTSGETLIIEPTETVSLAAMDRFIVAMISISREIKRIENGEWPRDNNPLRNAPHTAQDVMTEEWHRPYSRQQAAHPMGGDPSAKYWPPVGRISSSDEGRVSKNLEKTLDEPIAG